MTTCAGQPISWLALEEFALGEAGQRREPIDRHLAGCAACRGALAAIEADRGRALPALDQVAFRRQAGRVTLVAQRRARRRRAGAALGGAALAAAAALLLILWPERDGTRQLVGVKGGDTVLSLVRERGGVVSHDPVSYRDRDRFKLLVTCDAPGEVEASAMIFQGAEVLTPLGPALVRCGNRVPLPGAFRLSGRQPAVVCVALDGGGAACVSLAADDPAGAP
jgi:hypothetical protein